MSCVHSVDSGAEASVGALPVILSVSLLVLIVSAIVAVALAAVFIKRRRATHQHLNDSVTPQQCRHSHLIFLLQLTASIMQAYIVQYVWCSNRYRF